MNYSFSAYFTWYQKLKPRKADLDCVCETISFNIKGMTCQSRNYGAAMGVVGVLSVKADYRTGKAVVKIDHSKPSVQAVKKTIDVTPYKVVGEQEASEY